jgi:hypothetical protein
MVIDNSLTNNHLTETDATVDYNSLTSNTQIDNRKEFTSNIGLSDICEIDNKIFESHATQISTSTDKNKNCFEQDNEMIKLNLDKKLPEITAQLWSPEQIKYLKSKGLNEKSNKDAIFALYNTSFFQLKTQYQLSGSFGEKYFKCHNSDFEVTIRSLIHNHKKYKKTCETFTNREALIMEEQKHGASIYNIYRDKLEKRLAEFNEILNLFHFLNNGNIEAIIKRVTKMVEDFNLLPSLNKLIHCSNKKFLSGIIPYYLYNHYIPDNYKPSKCTEEMLLKQSFETGRKEFILHCKQTISPFKILTSARINKENKLEYLVALVPKEKVISLTQFDKPSTISTNNQNKKYKPKKKGNKNKHCKKLL